MLTEGGAVAQQRGRGVQWAVGRGRLWAGLACLALFVAASRPADARRRGRVRVGGGGLPGRGPYTADILTQDQLDRCIRLEASVNRNAEMLEAMDADLAAREASIDRLGHEIDRSTATLNRYSQAAVNNHNQMVVQHQALVRAFNASLPNHNAQIDAFNRQVSDFNALCAQKRYYEADMAAVRARLGVN